MNTTVVTGNPTTTSTGSITTYTQTTKHRNEGHSNGQSMMLLEVAVIALSLILFIGIVLYCRHLVTRRRTRRGTPTSNASVIANPNNCLKTEVSPYSVSPIVNDEKSFVDSRAHSAKSDSSLIKGPDSVPVYRSPCTEEYEVFKVGDNVSTKKYLEVGEKERPLSATQKKRKNRDGKPVIKSRKNIDKPRRFTDTFNDQMKPGHRVDSQNILRTYSDLPIITENSYVDVDGFELKRFHDTDAFTVSHTHDSTDNNDSHASIGVYDDPNDPRENTYDTPEVHNYYNLSQ